MGVCICVVVSHCPPGIQVINTSAKIIINLSKVTKHLEELTDLSMFHKKFYLKRLTSVRFLRKSQIGLRYDTLMVPLQIKGTHYKISD